jgi:hypothetical protein
VGWAAGCGTSYCVGDSSGPTAGLGTRSSGWHQVSGKVKYTGATSGDIEACVDDTCKAGSFTGLRTYIGFQDDGFYAYIDDFRAWKP